MGASHLKALITPRRAAALLLCSVGLFALDAAAAEARADMWPMVRTSLFKERAIVDDAAGEVVSLRAPARAQDAAVVPVSISTHVEQTASRYVSKVYLLIDQNPSPVAAIFEFTPDSGRADIETRVRVEDYTWMRAVAEMNDGKLYMSARYVKAAGGCSAPYGTAPDFDAFQPRMKLKVDASVVPGQPSLAQLMIQHPNSSGLAKDQMTQLYIPAYYVRRIEVTYAGRPILQAQVDFSISENPNFRFYFVPRAAGELKAVVVDTKDRRLEGAVQVELGQN
jgi:sulfur-oxidizing protein SoxY